MASPHLFFSSYSGTWRPRLKCGPVSSPLPRGRRRCDRDLRLLERPRAGNCYFGELFDLVKFVKIVRDAGLFISSALDHLLRPSGTLEAYEELHIIYSGDDEARGVLCLPGEAYHLSSGPMKERLGSGGPGKSERLFPSRTLLTGRETVTIIVFLKVQNFDPSLKCRGERRKRTRSKTSRVSIRAQTNLQWIRCG
ncbi:uncharacterized protein [Elaeis guineensis]|uniref:uncharacterized protein isoform X3 n=1 Tax=Elaeis guineensis var. tenera TaxID=51953 RepID=UPI003C6D0F1D